MKIKSILFTLLSFLLIQCSAPTEDSDIFVDNGQLRWTSTDSVSFTFYHYKADSVVTSGSKRLLLGVQEESNVGIINYEPIFEIAASFSNSFNTDIANIDSEYLGASITFYPDGYSFGDTTETITISLYELNDKLEFREDGYLYNNSQYKIKSDDPITSKSIKIKPKKRDSIEFKLNDDLGFKIYELIKAESNVIQNQDDFVKEITKGFVLGASTNKSFVLGISDLQLRVYYKNKTKTPVAEEWISFNASNKRYTHTKLKDASNLINALPKRKEKLPTSQFNSKPILLNTIGLSGRIEFPYIQDVLAGNKDIILNKVELVIKVDKNSKQFNTSFPSYIYLHELNSRNEYIGSLSISENQLAAIFTNNDYETDPHYKADITSFIKSIIYNGNPNKKAIAISYDITKGTESIERLIFNDNQSTNKSYAKFYFTIIE